LIDNLLDDVDKRMHTGSDMKRLSALSRKSGFN